MELLQAISDLLTNEVVALMLVGLFLVLFWTVRNLANRFKDNEQVKSLRTTWELIDDFIFDGIVEMAFKDHEREFSLSEAERYERELGFQIDWRMVLVLQEVEAYIEANLPIDVDLPILYKRAERIFQGLVDELPDDVDVEEKAEEVVLNGLS